MEEVIDALIAELNTMNELDSSEGGFSDFLYFHDIKFDDPGLVLVEEYPYAFVAPVSDDTERETVGLAGTDRRRLFINIVFVVNTADFFDPEVSEASGTRELIRASSKLRAWLRRFSKRHLLVPGMTNLVVQSTSFVPDIRGDAFVRTAVTTLYVDRQYQHTE